MLSKEDSEALDFVRDFLKQNNLKSTLECLEKEENYRNIGVEKKTTKVSIFFDHS